MYIFLYFFYKKYKFYEVNIIDFLLYHKRNKYI